MNKSEIAERAARFYNENATNVVNVPRPGHPEDKSGWDGVRRASEARFIAQDALVMTLPEAFEFAAKFVERAIAESRDDKIAEVRQFLTNMKRDAADAEDPELADHATAIEQILDGIAESQAPQPSSNDLLYKITDELTRDLQPLYTTMSPIPTEEIRSLIAMKLLELAQYEYRQAWEFVNRKSELGDGEPSPPPDSKIRQALMTHWLSQIECNHYEKSDSAICACGWKSERGFNVGKAVELWIDHVFLESGAAQEVSPTCPLCKKSNRFIRQPGTCSHPFHDEPFRKMLEEVSPPSPDGISTETLLKIRQQLTHRLELVDRKLEAKGVASRGDTRELKAALKCGIAAVRTASSDNPDWVRLKMQFLIEAERLLG